MCHGYHDPVLLQEALTLLAPRPGQTIVDGTLGDGGHAVAILEHSAPDGRLIGIDRDPEALEIAARRLEPFGDRSLLVHASFDELPSVLAERGIGPVDGVLLDLGVSSRQLDEPARGFRFAGAASEPAPLDMRMDPTRGATAAELLAEASEAELATWFRDYGELPGSHRLARAIVDRRRESPLRTNRDLLDVIGESGLGRGRRHHPATLVFQALRLVVNRELLALREFLDVAPELLAAGGRLVVIAYHSLEDRMVKRALRDGERGCVCPPDIPVCVCGRLPVYRRLVRRPVVPDAEEVARNPRARSAKLRAAERLPEAA